MVWDKEQKNIFISSDGGITKLDPTTSKQDRVGISGEMLVNTTEERQAMFNHVWRRTKKTFYTKTFHGITARIIQHEYDHIEGKLFIDYIKPFKKKILQGKLNDISKGKVKVDYKMILLK